MLFPKLITRCCLVLAVVFTLPLAAQLKTPPFNPYEPGVLSSPGQGVKERLDTRKWRRRYNQFELIVKVWKIYYARKKGADWKEIFRDVSGLMESELVLHQGYYDGLSQADAMVTTYYLIDDIRSEFKAIIETIPLLITATSDTQVWSDPVELDRIYKTSREIEAQAVSTLKYLTLVSGVNIEGWEEVQAAGVESVDEKYWASTADRLQHLDRIHTDLTTLRILIDNLYRNTRTITVGRIAERNEQTSVESLFSTN